MYSKRLDFRQGNPRVSIRIFEGVERASFSASHPGKVQLFGSSRRLLTVPPNVRWTVRVILGQPAVVRRWIQVAELEPNDGAALRAEADRWKQRGFHTQSRTLGARYGISGKVLDSRRVVLVLDGLTGLEETGTLQAQLLRRFGTPTSVLEELESPPRGTLELSDENQHPLGTVEQLIVAEELEGGTYEVFEDSTEHSAKRFRGGLAFTLDRTGHLAVVNRVPLEDLLRGLVPSEIPAKAPAQALMAQAVTARGEVLAKIGHKHLADPYLLCSEQHCAVYKGLTQETTATNLAVDRTRGQALFSTKGALVNSVYSAVCGGYTEDNDAVWGGRKDPSLRGKPDRLSGKNGPTPAHLEAFLDNPPPDAACDQTSFRQKGRFRWEKHLSDEEMNGLTSALGLGAIRGLSVLERGVSGRAIAIHLQGTSGETDVRGELNIRRLFGNLYSSMFLVSEERDGQGLRRGWRFRGGGWGHGVGMCQTGAMGRAEAGQNYREILRFYFNGAEVAPLY